VACVAISVGLVGSANAQVPDNTSTLGGPCIAVEGQTNGAPDDCSDGRCANYLITLRSQSATIPNRRVWIDFSGCSDIQISCDQLTAVTGQSDEPGKIVSGVTTDNGEIASVLVNGKSAALTATAPGIVDWTIALDAPADGKVVAKALDKAGNEEKIGHLKEDRSR